jgi:hypothetical protein
MQMREPNGMDKPGIQPKYAPIPRGSEGQAGGRAGGAHWLSPENKQGGWLAGCCPSGPPSPNLLKKREIACARTPAPHCLAPHARLPLHRVIFFCLALDKPGIKREGGGGHIIIG